MFEDYYCSNAELILIGYGIVSRLLQSVVDILRSQGKKVGMLRPISLFPFPTEKIQALAQSTPKFMVVELSNGQMVDDVRLALNGKRDIFFYSRMGGAVPSVKEIIEVAKKYL
jgi:pyruvate/2-oxoacid:ferredoxin oxidoreductase alpha subunit